MASSSSSQTKPTKVPLFKKPNSSSLKVSSLMKRQETVFKKAYELSTLCGIEVCVIYYGPDGELRTWPDDREKAKDMARRYSNLSEMKRRKGRMDLAGFLKKMEEDESTKKNKNKKRKVRPGPRSKYPDWDPRFDHYSAEQLMELTKSLEHNLTRIQHRFHGVDEAQKQRNMHNINMADQEQRMMINQLQHHPNQFSVYLVNNADGTLSSIQVPASGFNQAQSLAPIPTPLTIYQNPNEENHSALLEGQDTPISRLWNTNMLPYNSNNNVHDLTKQTYQNFKAENYPGMQGTGMNELQNMYNFNSVNVEDHQGQGSLGEQRTGINELHNMYGYNDNDCNTNGPSHPLAQFPTQRAGPASQFGTHPGHINRLWNSPGTNQ